MLGIQRSLTLGTQSFPFPTEFTGLSINHPSYDVEEPPPPMISSDGILAVDITEKFNAAAASESPHDTVTQYTYLPSEPNSS